MNVLVFTTLYPNREQPNHGIFVEKRVLELRSRTSWKFEVVAPVPWFPSRSERWGLYGAYARIPYSETRSGIRIHHPRYLVIPKLTWYAAPYFILLGCMRVLRRLRGDGAGFDIIDAHFVFPDGVAATMAGERLSVPVVMTARGSDVNDSPAYLLPKILLVRALSRAKRVIAVSKDLSVRLARLADGSIEIPVLANGVDSDIFYPRDRAAARSRYELEGKVVLTVGNLRRLKGHHLLIEAIAPLDDVNLIIVGAGQERQALDRLAADLGVSGRVRFMGAMENSELPDLYSAADVFALASSSEGCPNVILEAMACGTPIVATAVGAVPEMVPAQGREHLAGERTAAELRARLAGVLEHPPEASIYVEQAGRFGWNRTCVELAKIMREAATGA